MQDLHNLTLDDIIHALGVVRRGYTDYETSIDRLDEMPRYAFLSTGKATIVPNYGAATEFLRDVIQEDILKGIEEHIVVNGGIVPNAARELKEAGYTLTPLREGKKLVSVTISHGDWKANIWMDAEWYSETLLGMVSPEVKVVGPQTKPSGALLSRISGNIWEFVWELRGR